jgi:hypothetical protein
MTKLRTLLALVALFGLGWAASGCSSSCDDADELCDSCNVQRTGCKGAVDVCRAYPPGSEGDCCDNVLDSYDGCS